MSSLSLSASRLASYSCVFFVGFVNVYVLCKCLCYRQGKEVDTVTGWRCTLFLCTLVLIFFLGGVGGGGVDLVQSLKLSLNTVLSIMMSELKICWSHCKLIIFSWYEVVMAKPALAIWELTAPHGPDLEGQNTQFRTKKVRSCLVVEYIMIHFRLDS